MKKKTKIYKDFSSSINFKINKISRENKKYLSNLSRPHKDLGMPDLYMINVIGDLKKTTIKEIESSHWSDQALISRSIEKLSDLGYIKKINNTKDKRSKNLLLTYKGETIHKKFINNLKKRTELLFQDFNENEIEILKRLLDKLMISCKKYFH